MVCEGDGNGSVFADFQSCKLFFKLKQGIHYFLCSHLHQLSSGGQRKGRVPMKKLHIQLFFKFKNTFVKRLWRDIQFSGCGVERTGFAYCQKILAGSQIHDDHLSSDVVTLNVVTIT